MVQHDPGPGNAIMVSSAASQPSPRRETWTFHSAGQLLFGRHAVRQLGDIAGRFGLCRVLVVTDPVLEKAGLVDRVRAPLADASVAVEGFGGGGPGPSIRGAEACIAVGGAFQRDAVLGLGGGSNMALAKIPATVLAHGGGPRDYVGDDKIPGSVRPLVCVPTTAGTGSEVSAAA